MRTHERRRGVLRSPKLVWEVLVRGRYEFIYDKMALAARGMSIRKRWNLFRSGANLLHRRLNPWSMPLHMQFELTNYCNLRCPICPAGVKAITRPAGAMDPALYERVMEEVGSYLLTVSLWAWGEPLLHPQLGRILKATAKHPVVSLLSTNGQKLGEDRVFDAITEAPPDHLIVALDGITDATNSLYRVGARLAPALDGVRRLAEWKRNTGSPEPVLQMRTIIMKHNEREVPRLETYAREHGFDLLAIRSLSIIDVAAPDSAHHPLVPEAEQFRAYQYEGGRRKAPDGFICYQPFWFPTVLAGGELVSCEQDFNAQLAFGNVNDHTSFRDLWYSKEAVRIRQRIRDDMDSLSFCRNCPYAGRTSTDCTVDARPLVQIATPAPHL